MRTGDLSSWLDVSVSTIKNWAAEFSDFLSEDAQGGSDGRREWREYTELDTRIMTLIAALRDQNKTYEEIHTTLTDLQTNEWADLPQLPERPVGIGPVDMIPVSEHETAVNLEKQRLLREIAIREDQIEKLETELTTERTSHQDTREKLTEARENLGTLRGKLESVDTERGLWQDKATLVEQERQRERQLYTRALIGLVIAAAVLLTVILLLALTGGLPS